jgi:N-acetylglucosaminyl-diphospho-decaprenol L-rhamnosyltransferase
MLSAIGYYMNPLVSLIFISYNSARVLPACLESLATTSYAPYEVIVVDNASRDATVDVVRAQPDITLITNSANLGFGSACNRGARYARGELLVFLNPDITFTPNWLSVLVEVLQAEPTIAICAPVALYPDNSLSQVTATQSQADRSAEVRYIESATVSGAALLIRRTAWERLGGFDQRIFLYWEDTDLCWRAWLSGIRVAYVPDAIIYHERGGSGGGRRWASEAAKNGVYVYLKLMRWRKVVPYLLRQAIATLARVMLRQPAALAVWRWNLLNLPETLAKRKAMLRQRHIDPALLENLITQHDRAQQKRGWYT